MGTQAHAVPCTQAAVIENIRSAQEEYLERSTRNAEKIDGLIRWQKDQNGHIKDVHEEVKAIRTTLNQIIWWLVGCLLGLVMALLALVFQHIAAP